MLCAVSAIHASKQSARSGDAAVTFVTFILSKFCIYKLFRLELNQNLSRSFKNIVLRNLLRQTG